MHFIQFRPPPTMPARAHLVGICGAGMKALAEFLVDSGWQVSGCDGDPDPAVIQALARQGITVQLGHAAEHLNHRPELLIYSPAVSSENVERAQAARLQIPQLSYVDVLSQLTQKNHAVAIAGTHGKSTTTAMLGQILKTASLSASVICGAESIGIDRSGWAAAGETLVVEACEFRRHFLNLYPRIACVLGIEPDHFDCYPRLADAEHAYREFVSRIPKEGVLIRRSDCDATERAIQGIEVSQITFSLLNCSADWQAVERRATPQGTHFRLQHQGKISPEVMLQVPGLHNMQNALAAAACAGELGLSLEEIAAGLAEFRGLRRRFEIRGKWRGAVIVDDYAHHPTEIRATLTAAREANPGRRVICVFQPHQLSRTAALLQEFVEALSLADQVYLLPVYAARENAGEKQSQLSRELVSQMAVPATFISALDQVWGTIQTDAGNDAVILTLGAGNLSRIHHDHID